MDTFDQAARSRLAVGRYVLVLGDRAGTKIETGAGRGEPRALAEAIAAARRERDTPLKGIEPVEGATEGAAAVLDKVERATRLFTEIAEGRRDVASIGDEVDALLSLLGGLDRDGRWKEALRVARALAALLALLERWIELMQSLRTALGAAERIGDIVEQAWSLHELGTLHLAAGEHADADDLLSRAHDLRKQVDDRRGLRVTNDNLQVLCRVLRAQLHPPPSPPPLPPLPWAIRWAARRPLPALAAGILLLCLAGVAGAVIRGPGNRDDPRTLAVKIGLAPTSPRAGEPVAFRVAVAGRERLIHYRWRFGDGDGAVTASPAHVYRHPRTYTVTVTVSDAHGTATAKAAQTVVVRSRGTITRPAAPTQATASAGDASAEVTWAAAADGGSTVTSYTITPYIGSNPQPATTVGGSPPTTGTTIAGLTNGTTYTFTVAATSAVGTGPASAQSNAVTPAETPPPVTGTAATSTISPSATKAARIGTSTGTSTSTSPP